MNEHNDYLTSGHDTLQSGGIILLLVASNCNMIKVIISISTEHSMAADSEYSLIFYRYNVHKSVCKGLMLPLRCPKLLTFFLSTLKQPLLPSPPPLTCEPGVSYGTFLPIDNSKAATYGKFFLDNDEALLYF